MARKLLPPTLLTGLVKIMVQKCGKLQALTPKRRQNHLVRQKTTPAPCHFFSEAAIAQAISLTIAETRMAERSEDYSS